MPTARKTTSDQKEDMFVQIAHSSTQVDPIRHSSSGAQVPEDVGFKSPEIVLEDMINEVESWKTEAHNWREKFHARKRSSMYKYY